MRQKEKVLSQPDEPVIVVLKHPAGNVSSDQTQIVGLVATTWYHPEGLKPLITQARKLDAARTGAARTVGDRAEFG